jgi:hypothetical protein
VRLTVGGKVFTQPLRVDKDPRGAKASEGSEEEYKK